MCMPIGQSRNKMFHNTDFLPYETQHIETDHLGHKLKLIVLFPKWLFFQFNFGAKIFEIGHCVLKVMLSEQISEKLIFEKRAL